MIAPTLKLRNGKQKGKLCVERLRKVWNSILTSNWKLFVACVQCRLYAKVLQFQPAFKRVHLIAQHCFTPSTFPCGPINHILYYMAHWFGRLSGPSKARGKRFIGFFGWVSLVAMANGEEIHALVSVCWSIVGLPVILIIPAVCNSAPVGAGIFHWVRIRALFSSHRGPVETLWFAFSKGWRCFSSSGEELSSETVSLWLVAS